MKAILTVILCVAGFVILPWFVMLHWMYEISVKRALIRRSMRPLTSDDLNPGRCDICDKLGAGPMRVMFKDKPVWIKVCRSCQDHHHKVLIQATITKESGCPPT